VTINSLDQMIGSWRYDTPDTSRNNWLLALITLGEAGTTTTTTTPSPPAKVLFWWEIDNTIIF